MRIRTRAAIGAATVVLLAGCGGTDTGAEPSETVTVTETPDQDAAAPTDEDLMGEAPLDGDAFETVELEPGGTVDVVLPPDDMGGQPESFVEIDLGQASLDDTYQQEPGYQTIIWDMVVRNVGDGPANLMPLTFDWENEDGLVESGVDTYCEDFLETDLGPGQRTEGCYAVSVREEPGTLTLFGLDKNVTVAVDPGSLR